MLEKFENPQLNMFPIEADEYWRVMRQHKLLLLSSAEPIDNSNVYFPSTKYSFYRYFLSTRIDAKYWVPTMVINDIVSIYDYIDPTAVYLMPNSTLVEKIISSVG